MATLCSGSSLLQSVGHPKQFLVLRILREELQREHAQQREEEGEEQQKHSRHQHLQYRYQYSDRQQHKQKQVAESKRDDETKQAEQNMEVSQIELIYRAEGNANLVLALPQFKKVLRLPKVCKGNIQNPIEEKRQYQEFQRQYEPQEQRTQQQHETNHPQPKEISTSGLQENKSDAVGILTMDHYVAYISIIRCLVGNEFVFEADVVAVPNPIDRSWINEHIKPHRPADRLDKEFGGHFGLLLPDATQLPVEFDILFSNMQCKNQSATATAKTSHCNKNNNKSSSDNSCSMSNNIFGSDTFAIELKPKQGWLLPNDVNNLFDIKPKITQATKITQPPSLSERKKVLKAAVAKTIPAATETETEALKISTDSEGFTTTQNEPSQTKATMTTAAQAGARPSATSVPAAEAEAPAYSRYSSTNSMNKTSEMPRDGKILHPLYDKVDTRCRYCCMQFLKMKQRKIVRRSQYCPMDLFSGATEKMLFALQALFECPQNNLRIFRNGILIFDDQKSWTIKIEELFSSDKLLLIKHLLVTCLLREYHNKEEGERIEEKEQIVDDNKEQPLPNTSGAVVGGGKSDAVVGAGVDADVDGQPHLSVTSCKKQKFSTMPKATATSTVLTETEVTKVKSTLTSAKPIFSMDNTFTSASDNSTRRLQQISRAEVTCLPKNCVLQKIYHLQSLAKINLQIVLDHEYTDKRGKAYTIVCKLLEKYAKANKKLTLCQLSSEEQYILGATALDCSIMIAFREVENAPENKDLAAEKSPFVVTIFGRTFLTKVTLLDLDPKPDTHLHKYMQQIKQIVDALQES